MGFQFVIATGPVQVFSAAARKTRDLHAGSWILSEATKSAALALLNADAELIFPAANKNELEDPQFAAVNKILAVADTDDPKALADQAHAAANQRIIALADK